MGSEYITDLHTTVNSYMFVTWIFLNVCSSGLIITFPRDIISPLTLEPQSLKYLLKPINDSTGLLSTSQTASKQPKRPPLALEKGQGVGERDEIDGIHKTDGMYEIHATDEIDEINASDGIVG